MAKNNHISNSMHRLGGLLREQAAEASDHADKTVCDFARAVAAIGNGIAVVSDLVRGTSRIFCGAFADR